MIMKKYEKPIVTLCYVESCDLITVSGYGVGDADDMISVDMSDYMK